MAKLQNSTDQNTVSSSIIIQSATPYLTALGSGSAISNTGIQNTSFGYQALNLNTTGYENTAIGYQAMQSNSSGDYNVAVGVQALQNNTTGFQNTALGVASLETNVSGGNNTALGFGCLTATTGSQNTAVGSSSMFSNIGGNDNTATGFLSLGYNTSGNNNTATGYFALKANTAGSQNTAVGTDSLVAILTGSNNTCLGYNSGNAYTGSEAQNICIGAGVTGTVGESYITRIGIQGTQQAAYLAGTYSVSPNFSNNPIPVYVDNTGKLTSMSGGLFLLGSDNTTSLTSSFTGLGSYSFSSYLITYFINYSSANTGHLQLVGSTNNGSSYNSSGYASYSNLTQSSIYSALSTTYGVIANPATSFTNAQGYILISGIGTGGPYWSGSGFIFGTNYGMTSYGGWMASGSNFNAVQLGSTAGTISSKLVNIYGIY